MEGHKATSLQGYLHVFLKTKDEFERYKLY